MGLQATISLALREWTSPNTPSVPLCQLLERVPELCLILSPFFFVYVGVCSTADYWWWIPVAGPMVGGVVAAVVYYLLIELHHHHNEPETPHEEDEEEEEDEEDEDSSLKDKYEMITMS